MKHLYYYIFFFVLLFLVSCEDENKSQLTTSVTHIIFETQSGNSTFEVNSSTDWRITTKDDWISVTPSFGSGNQTVSVTVSVDDNLFDKTTKVIVCTKDGEKVVNIDVKVKGTKSDKEKYIDVYNHPSRLYFDGMSGVTDSLVIRSNFTWEIKGPEWIEAWDGARWRPLLQDRGVIKGNGTQTLLLRTARENKAEEDLEGIITLSEYLTGDYDYTIDVSQVGRMIAFPDVKYLSYNGAVFGWKCGIDVKKIYFKVTDDMNESVTNPTEIKATFDVTDTGILNTADRLSPNSPFQIISCGEDGQSQLGKKIQRLGLKTIDDDPVTNEMGMAYNPISAAWQMEDNVWRVHCVAGNQTGWWQFATNKANSAFVYNDQILGYLYNIDLPEHVVRYSTSPLIVEWTFQEITNEIHVFMRLFNRNHVYRYDRYYDADGKRLEDKPLLDRIPKSMINDPSLR